MSSPISERHLIQFGKSVVELMSRCGWSAVDAIGQSYQIVCGLKDVERLSFPLLEAITRCDCCDDAMVERMRLKENVIPFPDFAHVAYDARIAKFLSKWNSSDFDDMQKSKFL